MNSGGGRFPRMGGGRHHPYHHHHRMGPTGFDRGGFRENRSWGNYFKLFVGAVPVTATEEEIRPLFEEHGDIIEVAFIKDKRTGQQQSCCFVKYTTLEGAEKAIKALHNQYTLPGGLGPIQVRYADREKERLACMLVTSECKLYVASVRTQATEKDIEEIFSPYGPVEDVFILRDEMKQSRGSCFVKLASREACEAAINALNGTYMMTGCYQPLIVRFADPKKPKLGELRFGHTFGAPGFYPQSQATLGFRPTHNNSEPRGGFFPPNTTHSVSPRSHGVSFQINTTSVPADPTKATQSGPAVILFSSEQAHQTEDLQIPTSAELPVSTHSLHFQVDQQPDSQSSIQQNTPADSTQILLGPQQQDVTPAANQEKLPLSSTSHQLVQSPSHETTSSHTQALRSGTPSMSDRLSTPSMVTFPSAVHSAFHILCEWSEHTCPDGFKYYYNCMTRESRWEKPEEYAIFEGRQQRIQHQQKYSAEKLNPSSQIHLHLETQSTSASQLQEVHPQRCA